MVEWNRRAFKGKGGRNKNEKNIETESKETPKKPSAQACTYVKPPSMQMSERNIKFES